MVVVRTISKRELVGAMAWVTTPALIGPVLGPPVGGFITTYATWHWIFLINVPIGLLGIVLATRYIPDVRAEEHERFDVVGMILAGLGIGGMPRAHDVPMINVLSHPVPTKSNPLGAKGCGEAGTSGGLPSVANAVIDALSEYGIRHLEMPMTPARIWQAIQDAKAKRAS